MESRRTRTRAFKRAIETEPLSKSWSMRFGDDIIPFFGAGSAFYITHYFRKVLKIRPYATWTCYTPVLTISGLAITVFNDILTNDIVSGDICVPCTCTKSGLIQTVLGVGFPLVIAPIICCFQADRLVTYPVPPLMRAPREVLNLVQKFMQKKTRAFMICGLIQFTGAFLITWHRQAFVRRFVEE